MAAPQAGPGAQQASPEEQELYNRFVARMMQHLYDERTFPRLLEDMRTMEDAPAELGMMAATVAFTVMQKAKRAGTKIPGDVLLHGGAEMVGQLVEVYGRATGQELPPDQAEAVLYHAADRFRELAASSGDIDQQEIAAAMQDFAPGGDLEAMLASGPAKPGAQAAPPAPPAKGMR
jgi:hypothetical protein